MEYSEYVNIPLEYLERVFKLLKRAKIKEVHEVRFYVKKNAPLKLEAVSSAGDNRQVDLTAWIAPRIDAE